MTIYTIIGWLGAILFIVAYLLLTLNLIKPNKIPYQLMNVLGGLCLVINSIKLDDNPNFLLNFVWMCIGIFAIMNIVRLRNKQNES